MTNSKKEIATEPSAQLAVLIGPSFRRMVADEEFKNAVRTIWHRGRINTDMLTWENREGVIEQQELTFAYLVLEYSLKKGLRTGKIPHDSELESTSGHHPKSEMIEYDSEPQLEVLRNAHSLLAHCPQRDWYGQHLMEHVATELSSRGAAPPPPTFEKSDDQSHANGNRGSLGSKTSPSSPIPPWGRALLVLGGIGLLTAWWLK